VSLSKKSFLVVDPEVALQRRRAHVDADLAAVGAGVELSARVVCRRVLDREQCRLEAVVTIARVAERLHEVEARPRVELDHERGARHRDEAAVLWIEHEVAGARGGFLAVLESSAVFDRALVALRIELRLDLFGRGRSARIRPGRRRCRHGRCGVR
jgi:hypothetical protein